MELKISDLKGLDSIITPEIRDLYESKTWVSNSRIQYDPPHGIIGPFIDFIEPLVDTVGVELVSSYSHEVVNKNDDGSRNVSYGRVKIEARIGNSHLVQFDREQNTFQEVAGLIYAFDLGTPEIIVYHGSRAQSCLNLMVFNSEDTRSFNYAKDGTDGAFSTLDGYMKDFGFKVEQQRELIERLMNTHWPLPLLEQNIGKMLIHVINNGSFGSAAVNAAVKSLFDPSSKYAVHSSGGTSAWNVLQALTQYVTDKSYLNVGPEKSFQMADYVLNLG